MRWGEDRKGERYEVGKVKSGEAITRGKELSRKNITYLSFGAEPGFVEPKMYTVPRVLFKKQSKLVNTKKWYKMNICLEWEEVS